MVAYIHLEIPRGAKDVDNPAADVALMERVGATQIRITDSAGRHETEYVLRNAVTWTQFAFEWCSSYTTDGHDAYAYWTLQSLE